jgi:hypothetical protein
MAIKKINTDLQIEAGLLDNDGNSGSANQVLVSTSTGVDWVDGSGSGIIGGPYLPVANPTFTGTLAGPIATFNTTAVAPALTATSGWSGTISNTIIKFGRQALAVAGSIGYDDPSTCLYIGSTTNHAFKIRVNNSAIITCNTSGETIFTGNVGINTTAPTAKLSVLGNTTSVPTSEYLATTANIVSQRFTDSSYHSILQLVAVRQSLSTGNGANGYLGFSTVDDSNNQGIRDAGRIAIVNEVGTSRNSATALSFWTNPGSTNTTAAIEKMRIDSAGAIKFNAYGAGYLQTDASGNVTAGTVTTSDTLDDVTDNGNTTTNSITVGAVTSGGLISTGDNEFRGDTYLRNGGDDGAGARVGDIWYSVGTTGSPAPVGVYESAVITTVKNGTHGRSDIVFKTKDNDTANFGSTSERMRITKAGDVLIGATANVFSYGGPTLHVGGSRATLALKSTGSLSTFVMSASNSLNTTDIHLNQSGTDGSLSFYQYSAGGTTMTLNASGKLGLATTNPATLLHLGSSTNGTNIISLGEAGAGGPHGLDFYGDDATRTLKYSLYYRTGTENISMETSDGTKRFEITQTGAVTFNEEFTFPIADGSANQVLVTNGSGALSWTGGYTQYSPVGWTILNNQTYTSTGANISSSSTQALAGTTPVQRNSAAEFQATQQGWYEIQYSFIVKNNYANRANVGAYMGYQHGSGGGVISGSHSTDYVRYNTYGEYAQVQNTYYFYAPDGITKFYLKSYLLAGSMDMTTQALTQSMISFRYINNAIT